VHNEAECGPVWRLLRLDKTCDGTVSWPWEGADF